MASIRRLWADRAEAAAARAEKHLPREQRTVVPTGRWQVMFRDLEGRQRSQSFDLEREAKRFRAKVETQLVEDDWIDPSLGDVRFGEWLRLWERSRVVSRTSAAAEESMLRCHVRPEFEQTPLRAITKLRVQTWVAELERKGLAPASVAKIYRLFATVMAAAVDEQLVRQTPCRGIKLPRARVDERVFLDVDGVRRLVAEVPERYQALVVLAYLSGMRWSELAGLRVSRLELLARRLHVVEVAQEAKGKVTFGPPKSRASRRVITLPPAAVDAVAAHLAKWPAGRDDLVFVGPQGAPLSRTRFAARVLKPAWERAEARAWAAGALGLRDDQPVDDVVLERWRDAGAPTTGPRPTFHSLRHSHVASLIADGAPLKAVQERIGHGSIRVTYDTYGHLEDKVDDELLAGLQARAAALMPAAST
jgi:integrase